MNRCFAIVGLVAGGLLSAAGCSSGSTDNGSASSPTGRFFEQYGNIVCENAAPCCSAQGQQFDGAECRQFFALFVAGFAGNATEYDEAAAQQCFAELEVAYQSCPFGPQPPSCSQVLSGSTPVGAPCEGAYECVKGAGCDILDGVCKTVIVSDLGGPCGTGGPNESHTCGGGLRYCDAASGTCKEYAELDEDCSDTECVEGLRCDPVSLRCAALVEAGGACEGFGQCTSGHYCSTAGTCAPLKQDGEPCVDFTECIGLCDFETSVCKEGSLGENTCDIEYGFGG
jgi:hypothetical protein